VITKILKVKSWLFPLSFIVFIYSGSFVAGGTALGGGAAALTIIFTGIRFYRTVNSWRLILQL
jgi:hypothetical protein